MASSLLKFLACCMLLASTIGASVVKPESRKIDHLLAKKAGIRYEPEPVDMRGGKWIKLNPLHEVCFEARGDKPGQFVHYGTSGLVGAIKLVWKSGHVRCVSNVAHDSRWGCYHYSSLMKYPLNVVITDNYKNIIFPKYEDIQRKAGLWYSLPMMDDKHSDEIVFTEFAKPLYIQQYKTLKVWYGEDLNNWAETDNQGRVCVDVYGRFM
ncbi:uncharacterized protein LOC116618769 isoform X1 [Nematostella vectensis]|uniref:uncharacterized protein LOC116618769 isoform X1 n=1 Tax=Nematostella vectensis TaxID=45351 RepID=UPI00138FF34C|nr:uncharacterized protein LOC116618769 isoform X1 [Nematostella vectensis]